MSFGKSQVARFGGKNCDSSQKLSSTDMSTRIRSGSTETPRESKKGLLSQSYIETGNNEQNNGTTVDSKIEIKPRPRSTAGRFALASKINKPIRPSTRAQSLEKNPRSSDTENSEIATTGKSTKTSDSYETISSCTLHNYKQRSGNVGSKIPVQTASLAKTPGDYQRRNLENQYSLKAKRLSALKKELLEKQKPAIELYKSVGTLRKKILEMDGKCAPLDELKVVEYAEIAPPTSDEVKQTQEKIKTMKSRLNGMPVVFMDLCRKILDEKCSILDTIFDDEGEWSQDNLMAKIQKYKKETAVLEGRLESAIKEEEFRLRDLIKEWNMLAKIHPDYDETTRQDIDIKLQETELRLKQAQADLQYEKTKKLKDNEKMREFEKELGKHKDRIAELSKQLEEEKAKGLGVKARFDAFDQKMKQAKCRIKESDNLRDEIENKYRELEDKLKKAEEDWQAKEEFLETQNKDLQHYVKTQTDNVLRMESEKRSVNARCTELEEKLCMQKKELAKLGQVDEFVKRISALECELKESNERCEKFELENNELKAKQANGDFVVNNVSNEFTENIKSETEISLWTELKATKSALKLAEDKIALYTAEKNRFLETLNKEDDAETVNMTKHLMQKEELITNLILQNKQLKKSFTEIQEELEEKNVAHQELQDKINAMNENLMETDTNFQTQHMQYCDMHQKLQKEITRNTTLEQDLAKLTNEKEQLITMVKDFQHLFNVREQVLNAYKDKQQATEEQNTNLKDYVLQMRDQLNLISIEQSKKEHVIKTLTKLLDDKTAYIDKIEERIEELENSVHTIKSKRINTKDQEAPEACVGGLGPEVDEMMNMAHHVASKRESLQQFISHAEVIAIEEARHFQKKLQLQSQSQAFNQNSFLRLRPKPYELQTSFSANNYNNAHQMFDSYSKHMQQPKQ